MNDDVRLGLIVGGAALLVLAILWWALNRSRGERRTMRGLQSNDPQERARSGIRLVDLGLLRAARPLLDHVRNEQDSRVRLAIALAVARRQWEPSNAKRVGRLRDWAGTELQHQGQPVSGGPRLEETDPDPAPIAFSADAFPPPDATAPAPGEADGPIEWHLGGPQ